MLVCGASGRIRANPGGTAGVSAPVPEKSGAGAFLFACFAERGWPRDGGLVAAKIFGENYKSIFIGKGCIYDEKK